MVTWILVIVGGVNWGLVGLLGLNVVHVIFGMMPVLESLVYIAVGASAVWEAANHMKTCMLCMNDMKSKKKKK